MSEPYPIADCKCGHRFLDHRPDGTATLAAECTTAGCGCAQYRPKGVGL